jgi:hypothetical protein
MSFLMVTGCFSSGEDMKNRCTLGFVRRNEIIFGSNAGRHNRRQDQQKSQITIRQLLPLTGGISAGKIGRVPSYSEAITSGFISSHRSVWLSYGRGEWRSGMTMSFCDACSSGNRKSANHNR